MQTKRNQPAQSPYSRSRRVLLRYVLSYALILLIPCLLFSSVCEQHYEKAYTEKILAQHQIRLDRVYADFVALEENMQSIAVSLPVWDELKRASAMDAPTYAKLKKTLLVFSITNPAFEYLDYYTLTAPQFVFTSEGTYTPEYYSLYLLDGEWVQVDRRLSAIREGTWILPDEVQWNTFSGRKVRLEYIIPATSDKKSHVIFTINPQSLEGFVGILQDRPIVVMAGDKQIYPFDTCNPALRAYYEARTLPPDGSVLQSVGTKDGLWVAQRIDQSILQVDLSSIQRTFIMVFWVVLALGAVLVYLMAYRSYLPISKLETLARSKVPDGQLPEKLHELETAFFALQFLQEHNQLIKQTHRTDKVLRMLAHGHVMDMARDGYSTLPVANVLKKPYMCVVLMECLHTDNPDNLFSTIYEIMNENNESEGMEYIENSRYLFLVGMDEPDVQKYLPMLNRVLQETGKRVCIAVGDTYTTPAEICHSFRHAASLLGGLKAQTSGVHFYISSHEKGGAESVSLSIEARVYADAIRQKNTEKLKNMTDVLIDELRAQNNTFVSSLHAGNLIQSAITALGEIGVESAFLEKLKGYLSISSTLDDLVEILLHISSYTFDSPETTTVNMLDVCQFIMSNYHNTEINASYLADRYGIPLSTLSRRFKKVIGMTLSEYISKWQLDYAKEMLRDTRLTVASISEVMGHTQTSSFIRRFKAYEHMTPNEYRKKHGKYMVDDEEGLQEKVPTPEE